MKLLLLTVSLAVLLVNKLDAKSLKEGHQQHQYVFKTHKQGTHASKDGGHGGPSEGKYTAEAGHMSLGE